MPNTKAVGVAYSDPEFESVTVTGASALQAVTATTITATTVTGTIRLPVAAVAAAGTNQGTAAALAEGINVVSAADGTKGVILPTAVAGMVIIVKNTAAGALNIYPATGGAINAVAANGAYSITNLTSSLLVASSTTQWYSVPLVAS
jgi:DUF4097 and DUF4098 domain-containing protein YvlB